MDVRAPVVWIEDLETEVCFRLAAVRPVGRVAFVADDRAVVYPVNHRVDGHTVVFRTSDTGPIGELIDGPTVTFEVDDADDAAETGWSVLMSGGLAAMSDTEVAAVTALDVHPWAPDRDRWVRLVPDAVSGRAISRRRDESGAPVPFRP